MCGLAGILGSCVDREIVPRMIEAMKHRGPDSRGDYLSREIHLGHCRLAINDLSEKAGQPFRSEDNAVAVAVNGEIYNYRAIRSALIDKGYRFQSNSDCEVILHAYLDRGLDFIPDLNGMFAIAIWDSREQTLFLIRDRLGIKPLYYTRTDRNVVFASEIKALALCNDVDLSLDMQSFGEYLAFENYFGNRTLNEKIKLVEPGQIVRIRAISLSLDTSSFWQPIPSAGEWMEDHDIYRRYLEISEASVERHLISDVPVGCYLSSGIDSSSIAYWASRKLDGRLRTYTGYFGIDGFYDEATDAKNIAEQYGCANTRVDILPADVIHHIEKVLYCLDEPRVGMGAFSQYMVAKRASEDVKVILTGHGGDEFFAGYPVFKAIYGKAHLFKSILFSSPREWMFFVYFTLMPLFRKEIRYFLPNVYPLSSFRHILAEEFRDELQCRCDIFMEPEMLRSKAPDPYQQLILTYLKFYLPSLFLVEDKISMVFSLESRTPLCDNELLDFALKIPLSLKLKGFELKHIPRRAMKGKLPEFIYRRPKRGFPTPFVIWFRKELRDFIRCFILDHLSHLPMFDARSVEKMIHDFQHPAFSTPYDEIKAHRIWVLLNLIAYFKNQQTRYQDAA